MTIELVAMSSDGLIGDIDLSGVKVQHRYNADHHSG
jgi:hypothetical protein